MGELKGIVKGNQFLDPLGGLDIHWGMDFRGPENWS